VVREILVQPLADGVTQEGVAVADRDVGVVVDENHVAGAHLADVVEGRWGEGERSKKGKKMVKN
jgi:hypothetical protein